ncbi:MAG: hypothetical protein ABR567_00340 [Myxococcales bacterium]
MMLAVLLAACGGSDLNRASVSGKVEGTTLNMRNSAAFVVRTTGTPSIDVVLSNVGDGCEATAANLKSKQVLELGVTSLGGALLDAGTFGVYDQQSGNIPQGTVVFADYHSTNETCADTTPPNTLGASGKVTLDRVTLGAGGEVSGTFDLFLENGDHLKGSFDAPVCGDGPDAGHDGGCH